LLSSFSRIILHGQNLKFFLPSFEAIANEFQRLSIKKDLNFNSNFSFNKSIELKNVSFSYFEDENKILENISPDKKYQETNNFV
jgi:ABC-type bacteriocin/lantibiotic exporter with double-glycine peptidase domain